MLIDIWGKSLGSFFVQLRGQDKTYIQDYNLFQKTTTDNP